MKEGATSMGGESQAFRNVKRLRPRAQNRFSRTAVPKVSHLPGTARRRQIGLRAYLTILVMVALGPALLLGAATTWELGTAYRRAEEIGLTKTAQALATALDREIGNAVTALSTLSASPSLASGDLASVYAQAATVGRAFGGWVALLDADSQQAFNTLRPFGAELPRGSGDPFVGGAIATGHPVVSNLFMGATARRLVVAVFHPLPPGRAGAAPHKSRVLLLAFSAERLSSLLEHQDLNESGGFAVLTDGNNRVVARSSEHARFVNQLSPDWYVAATSGSQRGLVRGVPALAGFDAVVAFQRLDFASSWVVAVTIPFAPYQAQLRGPVLRFAIGSALVAACAAILAVLVARRLLRPLQMLARDAEVLSADDVPVSSRPERITELEALRQALWRSVSALRARGAAEGRAMAVEEAAEELKQAARRRDLLVKELNHRVKNMLLTVQSLASQTLRSTRSDSGRFVTDFSGRLSTLAQAHDLLTAANWESASVAEVVSAALAPWHGEGRISRAGPEEVRLDPAQAQALVLALHELATNALKYGALSATSGTVEVCWRVDPPQDARGTSWLTMTWQERGGPTVQPRSRRGFGTRLLEHGLPHQLRGEATLLLPPGGIEYRIRLPLNPDANGSC
jgi:two-component sensor histidine kinase/HAMP domain-containing protein